MRIGSLFSGAGGLDLAVESVFGGHTVWHSEIDKAASKVLAYRWLGVPNLGSITEIDWAAVEPVDVLCGGWPCQPFSLAGKQKGIHDDRALWPYVAGAIRELRPRIVVLENVSAVLTAGEFDRVASDLAACGYEFAWTCARASDVGAPHTRERLFVVAHAAEQGLQGDFFQPGRYVSVGECGDHPVARRPMTAAADGSRGQDYARANRSGSGGDDLAVKAHNNQQWGRYSEAIERWEQILGCPAPSPTEPNTKGNPRLNPAFSEFLMGWERGWVTDPDVGISRADQLKCIGNGVVPQQAAAALRYLLAVTA